MANEAEQEEVSQDAAAPAEEALPAGIDGILADLPVAAVKRIWAYQLGKRPRDMLHDYALERIASLKVRIRADGDRVLDGWIRELAVMVKLRRLIEWIETEEMKKIAEDDRRNKGRK